nr:hypothetical protein [Microbacterium lemovicicum]
MWTFPVWMLRDKPVEAVAETLDLKLRTATNWVARARSAGHLTETRNRVRCAESPSA